MIGYADHRNKENWENKQDYFHYELKSVLNNIKKSMASGMKTMKVHYNILVISLA